MARGKKYDRYLAVWIGNEGTGAYERMERAKAQFWDMLRYDRCFPVEVPTRFQGWLIFCQPYTDARSMGFTLGRWESFGAHFNYLGGRAPNAVTGMEEMGHAYAVPFEMEREMTAIQRYFEERETAKAG